MIIDDKGRVFGKINIIDLLVVIFILSLTPMFWYGYKIFNKKPIAPIAPIIKTINPQEQIDNFLKEHKKYRKYFQEAPDVRPRTP